MHAATSLATSSSGGRAVASPRPASRRAASADPRAVRVVRAVSSSGDARSDDASSSAPPEPVVAVVTTSGCPHCRRAKTALDAANVSFVEIDASAPDGAILDASRAASGMRTVPQVFVGGAIFGGADDLEAGLASGAFASALDAASRDRRPAAPPDLARAVRTAAETAARSAATTTARHRRDADDSPADDSPADDAPDDAPEDFAALDAFVARMSRELTPTDRWTFGGWRAPLKLERACVDGATIFAWLESSLSAESPASDSESTAPSHARNASSSPSLSTDAESLARQLTDARLVSCVDSSHPLLNDPTRLYRLSDHASAPRAYPGCPAAPLNARRRWRGERRDARVVAASLRDRILALYDVYLSSDGRHVDYAGMRASPEFAAYVDATAELQTVDVHALTRAERVAFFLNVYNALVVHVSAAVGPPSGFFDRLTYFDRHAYDIGGHAYTCDDIEHGVLRGNRPGAASVEAILGVPGASRGPFGSEDPRAAHACVPMDPRIHFALVCGARSCPPIRTYTAEGLDAQLAAAAEAFVAGDVEVGDDAATTRVVTVSKITGEWYAGDFGRDDEERLRALAGYLPENSDVARAVAKVLDAGGEGAPPVKLVTREYDWTRNGDA
jgi:glutaredoxin